MRRTVVMVGGAAVLAVAGCGGGAHFADLPRPPEPINVTVYVSDHRVSVSPDRAGAGPVTLIVTNGASRSESLLVQAASGSATALADTGPISPQATATVKVDLRPGEYLVATGSVQGSAVAPAPLHMGAERPSSSNVLLQP